MSPLLLPAVARVWAGSDYVAEQMTRRPQLVQWLAEKDRLQRNLGAREMRDELRHLLQSVADENSLHAALRFFRHCHLCRIIWRDLMQGPSVASYQQTVADLSALAAVAIDETLKVLFRWACGRDGAPCNGRGQTLPLVVLAMGKLGAGELNLSSDIDLIFTYEFEGETEGVRREQSFHQFYIRLGQQLIRALDQVTADGFVFRVDMRLRPWGKSGALAIGFDAFEYYYETHGREWERYAMIKMQPVAGDLEAARRLRKRLEPFVYRRYADYGAFQSLREMKALIEREVERKGIRDDVKLGPGGIREVEFIVQAFQLIRGGLQHSLREPQLLKVLPELARLNLLSQETVTQLEYAYVFLRNVEHRIQSLADRQTQRVPEDDTERLRLAYAMGYADTNSFMAELERVRINVRTHFANVMADTDSAVSGAQQVDQTLTLLWQGRLAPAAAEAYLRKIGIQQAAAVREGLEAFRCSKTVSGMQSIGRERLNRLMPLLLETLAAQQQGHETFDRLLAFLEEVLRRSAYIALLVETPLALTHLVKLVAASPQIAEQLRHYPVLLEALLDVEALYAPPAREVLEDELRQLMLRLPAHDLEQQMETLRHFKQAHLLKVSASEVGGSLPLMKVSDYLSWLAEAILNEVFWLAWSPLVEKHGRPTRDDGSPCDPDFVIVGYGKLGGIELAHNSDLDLVFLHGGSADGSTDGSSAIANEQFFSRLGQHIIHILTTRTLTGALYEVDMRLRPSGASGLLVSSLAAFERYQLEQAWTWEHQALVRARPVAGCPRAAHSFEQIRKKVLAQPRPEGKLREDVLAMRERMLAQHGPEQDGVFDLKQSPGAIVDIEFMVQYGVLRWASQQSELTRFTDNVRLLETLAAFDFMPVPDAGLLREAYLLYRAATHRQALRGEASVVTDTRFAELAQGVRAIWNLWFE